MDEQLSPEQLLEACCRRDEAAWTRFISRYDQVIKLSVLRVLRTRGRLELSEDAVQQVYAKLVERAPVIFRGVTFPHEGSDFGFIKIIAIRTVQDLLKASAARPDQNPANPSLSEIVEPGQSDERVLVHIEAEQAVGYLRKNLPPEQAERDVRILLLRYVQGYTAEAISKLPSIELSRAGVDSVIYRCKELLLRGFRPGEHRDSEESRQANTGRAKGTRAGESL